MYLKRILYSEYNKKYFDIEMDGIFVILETLMLVKLKKMIQRSLFNILIVF